MTRILDNPATCGSTQSRRLSKERRSITVIFPAYNEAANIRHAIEESVKAMSPRFDTFELLIINDGSQDNTGSIAEELAEIYPEITVLHNERNMGLGETLYRGFQCARGELVIQNAMDYPLDLRDLDRLLPVLDEADVVVAVRKAYAGYTPYRKLTSKVNRALLRFLFEPKLRDYNYTQLFKREVLEAARPTSRSTAFIAPEILIRAYELDFRIKEVEVDFHPRIAGEATSGKPGVILRSVRDLFTFWFKGLFAGRQYSRRWPSTRGCDTKNLIASPGRKL
ncbi:MAG TPA: glycosyltransferase family 2 protein [Terracidiphilus sp.]|jgi:dolichol-phosphate mannosyltransferase|nr:glycosyltransferase family 2 protein [Terracidiphilus sp.]